jgi:hypothetical protein
VVPLIGHGGSTKMYGRAVTTWLSDHKFWPNQRIEGGSSLPSLSQRTGQVLVDLAPKWGRLAKVTQDSIILIGVVQMHEVAQDSINLSLMSGTIEGSILPLAERKMWETMSIRNKKPLPIGNMTFSYISLIGLIIGRASRLVGISGDWT